MQSFLTVDLIRRGLRPQTVPVIGSAKNLRITVRKRTGPLSALSSSHVTRHVIVMARRALWSGHSVLCALCVRARGFRAVSVDNDAMMDFSVCYVLINIHTYTTSALFQGCVPVFSVSVVCCNTSDLSDGCVPGLVRV